VNLWLVIAWVALGCGALGLLAFIWSLIVTTVKRHGAKRRSR
jgi:hypothetical protein